ncbi:MAG: lysylphosphatidylglycerol synthase domain-containing protein [Vicinamibacterales bacterium]
MIRSLPRAVSTAAAVLGTALFVGTLLRLDLSTLAASIGRLGLMLPVILLPGTLWHLLRTWGWAIAFPDHARPAFSRLFRVRLAADAVGFFTVRGLAGEPLKVLLLYDRVPPGVTTAAVALERAAFAIISTLIAGVISGAVLTRLDMPGAWSTVFAGLSLAAFALALLLLVVVRHGSGVMGRLVRRLDRASGRRLGARGVTRFLLEVEVTLLGLLGGNPRRLTTLLALPVVCYALMGLEAWLVLWTVGETLSFTQTAAVETFTRLASVASAAIPANLGALEASNAAVVTALGLSGGGALALVRRVRSLLWAGLGLALYPKPGATPTSPAPALPPASPDTTA